MWRDKNKPQYLLSYHLSSSPDGSCLPHMCWYIVIRCFLWGDLPLRFTGNVNRICVFLFCSGQIVAREMNINKSRNMWPPKIWLFTPVSKHLSWSVWPYVNYNVLLDQVELESQICRPHKYSRLWAGCHQPIVTHDHDLEHTELLVFICTHTHTHTHTYNTLMQNTQPFPLNLLLNYQHYQIAIHQSLSNRKERKDEFHQESWHPLKECPQHQQLIVFSASCSSWNVRSCRRRRRSCCSCSCWSSLPSPAVLPAAPCSRLASSDAELSSMNSSCCSAKSIEE